VIAPSLRARLAGLFQRPFFWTIVLFLLVVALVRPWGNFPLNDDWQYARMTKALAETGHFRLDVKIAPSLVGQAYLAAPFVVLFGFSHTLLRVLTMALALLLLRAVDQILLFGGASRPLRLFGCALLIVNPIFLHVAFSFMTEIWGYALALSAAWIWFAERAQRRDQMGEPVVSWRTGILVALLVGASFWVRQFCVSVFFPLWAASLLGRSLRCDARSVVRSLPIALGSSACFVGLVLAYFAWAKATGNYRREFHSHLGAMWRFDARVWWLTGFEVVVYLTAFLYPFLLVGRWRNVHWGRVAVALAATAILTWQGKEALEDISPENTLAHHVEFPYAGNLIFNAGIGPITLTPTYFGLEPGPHWQARTWRAIEVVLLGLAFAWSLWLARRRQGNSSRLVVTEVQYFGLLFAGVALAINVQAYHRDVFDRYYFPCVIAAVIALATSFTSRHDLSQSGSRMWVHAGLVGLFALPLAWFAVGGEHDYFRWNYARWKLVGRALQEAPPNHVDGGFEVNGWLNYDDELRGIDPTGCRGPCSCAVDDFFCRDDSYQISFSVPGGREAIEVRSPHYWLWRRGDVVLTRRNLPPPRRHAEKVDLSGLPKPGPASAATERRDKPDAQGTASHGR
jgi:hypothetical protein